MRVMEKKKEIEDLRKKWEAETKRVTILLDLSFQGSERMRILKAEELKKFWQNEKKRIHRKADNMVEKQNPIRKTNVPVEYRGILIGDQELIDKFGQTSPSIAVYGGIVPSDNVIKFLQLPARLRRFGNIDKLSGIKKTEEYATGRCWDM